MGACISEESNTSWNESNRRCQEAKGLPKRRRKGKGKDKSYSSDEAPNQIPASSKLNDKKSRKLQTAAEKRMRKEIYGGSNICYHATNMDREAARAAGTSLTYGEMHHEGTKKMMDKQHMNIKKAKVLLDIGSGSGKLVIQCFDQYKHLDRAIGVEISGSRYDRNIVASKAYADYVNETTTASAEYIELDTSHRGHALHIYPVNEDSTTSCGYSSTDTAKKSCRILESHNTDIGNLRELLLDAAPEVVVMDVMIHGMLPENLVTILTELPVGARLATFEKINDKWPHSIPFPFVPTNIGDTYRTTWNANHGFYLWRRTAKKQTKRRDNFALPRLPIGNNAY